MGASNRLIAVVGICYIIYCFVTFTHFQELGSIENRIPKFRVLERSHRSAEGLLGDVLNATLGFEKIFAINLPERTDHRDALILQSIVSDIEIDFINGVDGGTMSEKSLPPGMHDGLGPRHLGAWRGHINAISEVVHRNLGSALIMEDDVDWDVRLKPLLKGFATAANVLQQNEGDHDFHSLANATVIPTTSPYGEDWDLLWLGHCGMKLAVDSSSGNTDKVMIYEDESVPQKQHYRSFDDASPLNQYPHHTRVIAHTREPTCSNAYAISNRGARRLLLNLGLQKLDGPFDNMIAGWCEGQGWRTARNCYGVIPSLFGMYRTAGSASRDSDIDTIKGTRDRSFSPNIRYSVRNNLERILNGDSEYDDQYPDA